MTPTPGLAPRRASLEMLAAIRAGRTLDAALDAAAPGLADPDRRLAHELAAGVLRHRSDLDDRLRPLVHHGWRRVAPPLQDLLRLGAYQLVHLDRIPAHAAVSTSVALAREVVGDRAGGFVNAVLRRVQREPGEPSTTTARRHSHPEWLVQRWHDRLGAEETDALLQAQNRRPPLVLQPAREELDTIADRLDREGVAWEPAPFGAGLVLSGGRPRDLPGFAEGAFHVQDPAQALVCRFTDPPGGSTLYDACAAPGGKTIALGRRVGRVIAGDWRLTRIGRLRRNLQRAGGGNETVVVADARTPPLRPLDAVLVDAPCLGTGTLARHPDARWRVTPEGLAALSERQAEILRGVAHAVAPGGLLVYATCSLEPEENQEQVDRFLREHADFRREASRSIPPELLTPDGDLTLWPQQHDTDGAYAARLRRVAP